MWAPEVMGKEQHMYERYVPTNSNMDYGFPKQVLLKDHRRNFPHTVHTRLEAVL